MQDNTNHHQHIQPIQAPPALLMHVLERIQQAEQAVEDMESISTALASSAWPVRVSALERLIRVEKAAALPWLARALADEHPSVRAWTIHVLALHRAYEFIRPALHDHDWQVREAAVLALDKQDESTPTEFLLSTPDQLNMAASQPAQAFSFQHALHSLHAEGTASMRPINQATTPSLPFHDEPGAFQETQPRQVRTSPMQFSRRDLSQRKRLPRLLGLAAAVLVSAALIAGMVLAYATLSGNTSSPSHSSPAAQVTPSIPPACRDVQDQADETLCVQHKETLLNLTKNFSGHNITFVRAYADISRLMLVYTTTDSPQTDTISFLNVTVQQGIKLGGGGGLQIVYKNPETHLWYYLVSFEMKGVPANTPMLHVKGITDAFSGTETTLDFTIPFHSVAFDPTLKSISVKQTAADNGVALTLDHLAFTLGGTFLYFEQPPSAAPGLYLNSLSINGQQVASSTDTTSTLNPLVIQLTLPLLDKPGTWTVQIMAGRSASQPDGATWTFHFTVARTSTK